MVQIWIVCQEMTTIFQTKTPFYSRSQCDLFICGIVIMRILNKDVYRRGRLRIKLLEIKTGHLYFYVKYIEF